MKNLLLKIAFSIALMGGINYSAQAQNVRETSISYLKQNVNGYVGDYNVPKAELAKIAENYFSKNIKGKRLKNKDFYQYKGVNWSVISLEKGDIYYKIDGNKKTSSMTILVSKGYDNYISSQTDAQLSNELKAFFTAFNQEVDKHFLEQRIADQKKVVAQLEKDHKNMLDEEKKLQKKIADIEKDINNNKKKYEEKAAEINKNVQILTDLENQRGK